MKKFKNRNISQKLNTSFTTVIIILLLVGIMGIIGMQRITQMDTHLYTDQTAPFEHLISAEESLYRIRIDAQNAVIYAGDAQIVSNMKDEYLQDKETYLSELELFKESITSQSTMTLYNEVTEIFTNDCDPAIASVFTLSGQDCQALANEINSQASAKMDNLVSVFDRLINSRLESAKATSDNNDITANVLTAVLSVLVLLGAVYAFFLSHKLSKVIGEPVKGVAAAARRIAEGRLDVELPRIDSKDETGQLVADFTAMLQGIQGQVLAADAISKGDFTQEVPLRSENDTLGIALQRIEDGLSRTLLHIREASEQVTIGAEQISVGAQSLASGATEQASSVEELNTAITEVSAHINENAESARKASKLSQSAQEATVQGDSKMKDMMSSMREISEASTDISKIVKAINDIAFQTNILALNAAVEAARAGEAGKGFAVVAEEVRNLAAKSAEAAKKTTSLIESSVLKTEAGTKAVNEAASILSTVSESVRQTAAFVEEIAAVSKEQAGAISQISQGVSQVSSVVQTNSATAEESAASSEELSGQAKLLSQMVAKFQLKNISASDEDDQPAPESEEENHEKPDSKQVPLTPAEA